MHYENMWKILLIKYKIFINCIIEERASDRVFTVSACGNVEAEAAGSFALDSF